MTVFLTMKKIEQVVPQYERAEGGFLCIVEILSLMGTKKQKPMTTFVTNAKLHTQFMSPKRKFNLFIVLT